MHHMRPCHHACDLNDKRAQANDVEPTLKALQKLSEDKLEVSEEGEVSLLKTVGLRHLLACCSGCAVDMRVRESPDVACAVRVVS